MNWYVVHTKPRGEEYAVSNLKRVDVETFSPKLKQNKVIRRKRQTVISPLFPRYLFARFDLSTQYRAVKYAHGVVDIVRFGLEPAIVEEEVVASIKSRVMDNYITIQPPMYTKGDLVRIQEGPFQGLETVFEEEMSNHQRVILMLRALSYQARIVIDRDEIKAVSSS